MLTATVQPALPRVPREYPTEWTMYATREEETPQTPQRENSPPGPQEKDHGPQ